MRFPRKRIIFEQNSSLYFRVKTVVSSWNFPQLFFSLSEEKHFFHFCDEIKKKSNS